MNPRMETSFAAAVKQLDGLGAKYGIYVRDLEDGGVLQRGAEDDMLAASIIKLFILACTFDAMERGKLRRDDTVCVRKADCVPPSGVLVFMHDGLQVTIEDLYTLMTVVSDNTATNLLIDLLGMDSINAYIRSLGFTRSTLRRKMYDTESARRGIQNTITAREVGELLTMMYEGRLVSKAASAEMLRVLKGQQVEHKLPFLLRCLEDAPEIAHKTGEDEGITHDCGIVYGRAPFVLCMTFNRAEVPACERAMGTIALALWQSVN